MPACAHVLFAFSRAAPALPRHKGKQFLTAPPKKPIGGSVGFFHPLKHPTGEKFVDTTGATCLFASCVLMLELDRCCGAQAT